MVGRKMKNILVFLCLFSVMLLPACQRRNETSTVTATDQSSVTYSSMSLSARPAAKPGAQVRLASDAIVNLKTAETTDVDILLNAQLGDGNMHVTLNPSAGLELLGGNNVYTFNPDETGQYPLKVAMSAAVDGRYYLNLNVVINKGESSLSRTLALIVQVGAAPVAKQSLNKVLKTSTNENIISLPVQEQISH